MDLQFTANQSQVVQDSITTTLQQLDQSALLTTAHVAKSSTLNNHRNISQALSKLSGPTAVLHANFQTGQGTTINAVRSLTDVHATPSYLLSVTGVFTLDGGNFNNLLIVDGPPEFYFLLDGKLLTKRASMSDADGLLLAARAAIEGRDSIQGSIREAEYDYYDVSARELVALLEDPSISNISKVISAFYTYLPMCRTTIALLAHLTPVPDSVTNTVNGWAPDDPGQDRVEAASGISLFSPAYSIKENMPSQIERRLKAVAAAADVAPPGSNVVADLFTTSGMGPIDFPSKLVPILASAVCIDRHGRSNPDVKTDDLMELDELTDRYGLVPWVVELITQMRLIYTAYQASSLRFGLAVLDLIVPYFTPIGGIFVNELEAMGAVKDTLSNASYTGMRSKIPEGLQVKTVARVVYVGLGYYRKCLTTEEEKKAFEKYATTAIRHHIHPLSDADMCDHIIHVLPDRSLVSAIALGQNLSFEEMDIIMQRYSVVEQAVVYKSLLRLNLPGEWALHKKKVADNEAAHVMMLQAMETLLKEEKERESEMELKLKYAVTDEEYAQSRDKLVVWKERVSSLKRAVGDIEDLLPLTQDPQFDGVREEVIGKLKALYNAIRDVAPDQADQAASEDEEPST